jgi:protein-disulfide isomerase
MPTRRLALVVALVLGAAAVLPAAARTPDRAQAKAAAGKAVAASADMSLGSPRAKVQVIEYASLSCPHCARFNNEVFPAFKAKYVDTGQVRYTLRELLTPPAEVAAYGFLMARCAGPKSYFKVVDEVFKSQPRWADGQIEPIFLQIAKDNGLSKEQLNACITSKANQAALRARVEAAVNAGVNSTPTFIINGKKHEGEMTLEELDAAIAEAKTGG